MTEKKTMNRREFAFTAAAVGAGMAIGFRLSGAHPAFAAPGDAEMNAWVVVGADNITTIRIGRPDVGQGVMTATTQFVADEMDADWNKIKTEFASQAEHIRLNLVYGSRRIAGSASTPEDNLKLRQAGAHARARLLKAAAARLNVPEAELTTANSVVTHKASNRSLTYGALAADAAKLPSPDVLTLKLKEPKDWVYIGKPMKRVDTAGKVNGAEIFGIDLKLPGMKYAAVMTSPTFGGKIKSYDANVAMARPGVRKVVEVKALAPKEFPAALQIPKAIAPTRALWAATTDSGIAVIADTWWQAKTALDAMPKEWDEGPNAKYSSADYDKELRKLLDADKAVVSLQVGDAAAAFKNAAKVVEAEYYSPMQHHATMEPMACTVLVTDDRFELWLGTQEPDWAIVTASLASGIPVTKGELNVMKSGGGFGRRLDHDYVNQATQIAAAMKGTPVKLIWSREEDMRHGRYHYTAITKMKAGLDAAGNIVAWQQRIAGNTAGMTREPDTKVDGMYAGGIGGTNVLPHLVAVPNLLLETIAIPTPIPLGSWRSVGDYAGGFFHQCFIDELAYVSGKDPLQYQRALLDSDKLPANLPKREEAVERARNWRKILDLAAEKADWGKPMGPGRGRGIAIAGRTATTGRADIVVATVAEVTLDGGGGLKVDRLVMTVDPGNVVNPEGIATQLEGGAYYGLAAAMYQEINVRNGRTVESNFDDYPTIRLGDAPKIETYTSASGKGWSGIGELPMPLMPPSLGNAIYAAGGPRVRAIPFTKSDLTPRRT